MGRINILDTQTANAIKAGEVVDRPVSVVKELFDNSADAGANSIKIEFNDGGISMIRVTDNGCGMDREDAAKCFLLHATSKLRKIEDVYNLSTQGFRGEALASIAACSDITLLTKQRDSDIGTKIVYENGVKVYEGDGACDNGTVVEVKGLFRNIPARYKFLKKDSTEGMYICQLVEKLAIINPQITVKLIKDGKLILSTPGNGDDLDTIYSIYGKQTTDNLKPLEYKYENYRIEGYAGKPSFVRGNRSMQCVFVNDRPVHNQTVSKAIEEAYKNAVMKGKFPVCFLMIYCPPGTVDVNVHPQKAEVRFDSESDIFRLVYHGIRNVLFEDESAPEGFTGESKTLARPSYSSASSVVSPSYNPVQSTQGDVSAANKLLELLSEYKPDVSAMEGGVPVSLDKEAAIEPVREQVQMEMSDLSGSVSDNPEITELINADYIGTLFATYIVMQSDSNVFFVDQHAAHERVMYERFMGKKISKEAALTPGSIQKLLVPQIIKVSSSDYTFIADNIGNFMSNGYEIDVLDDREIALRSVPMMNTKVSPAKMFEDVLSDLKHDTPDKNDLWYHLIQTTACKAAVKAGDKLDIVEIRELLSQMQGLNDPYHCAHGRPTFFKVSRTDLEKRFKRIV